MRYKTIIIVALLMGMFLVFGCSNNENKATVIELTADEISELESLEAEFDERPPLIDKVVATKNAEALANIKLRIGILRGASGIGMSPLMKGEADGETSLQFEFVFNKKVQDLLERIKLREVNVAVLPTHIAAAIYNDNDGGIQLLGINGLGSFPRDKDTKKIEGKDFPITCIVIDKSFGEEHPMLVRAFVTSYKKSVEGIVVGGVDHSKQVVEYGIMKDEASAEKAIERTQTVWIDGKKARDLVGPYLETIFEVNPELIGGVLPDETFYYEIKARN